jgi:pilus assembly protein CpaB
MSRRALLILLALLLSAGAIFITPILLRGPGATRGSKPTAPAHPVAQVLVAKSDLYIGDTVKPADLAWQAWPDGPLPPSYIVLGKARLQDVAGTLVTNRIAAGDPITLGHLTRPTDRGALAAILGPGDRAVTVNVTPSTGMAGFLAPGDRVDVILTQTVGGSGPGAVSHHVSETVLHGIRVVGVDQTLTDKKDDKKDPVIPKTATLEVTPKEAEIIAVAGDMGVLSLALDSLAGAHDDGGAVRVTKTWDNEATQIAVAGVAAAPAATTAPGEAGSSARPTVPMWTVEVVRGGIKSQMEFPISRRGPGEPSQ